MSRWISLLVFGAFAAALFLLPEADSGRLAAIQAHQLLAEQSGPDAADPTHADLLLRPPAATLTTTPEGAPRATLAVGGVRVAPPEGTLVDLGVHALARRSVLRGLREAAGARGIDLVVEGETTPVEGGLNFTVRFDLAARTLALGYGPPHVEHTWIERDWPAPRRVSLFPPLFAIALAILLRRPVISLAAGAYAAATLLAHVDGAGPVESVGRGVVILVTDLLWNELVDNSRIQIVGFVVFMLSMVGVLTRGGGIRGMMDVVARLAKSARGTLLATYLIGLLIFFDDYANTILCGSTMRPLADRFRIAREKLAYIVDSTAAPVAGLSLLSTWIAFEVSTFSAQLPAANLLPSQGYEIFIQSLPYRFYCVFTLVFVGLVVVTGRDFGPMLSAERRARTTGALVREGGKPMVGRAATSLEPADGVAPSAVAGLVPILLFVLTTLVEILRTGGAVVRPEAGGVALRADFFTLQGIAAVLGAANVYWALLLGSFLGFAAACLFAWRSGLRTEILHAAWTTLRSMGIAIAILYLAWMLGRACKDEYLGTATYLTALLGDRLSPALLPSILFLLAALVALSTGSSWSTMTILLPLVVGLAYGLGQQSQFLGENSGHLLLLMSIGAVLEGAIFGDHCSPISDTTVLSSVACASDHVDHVRTQAPYAILTMLVALTMGYIPCALLGWSPWAAMAMGVVVLVLVLRFIGRRPEDPVGATVWTA